MKSDSPFPVPFKDVRKPGSRKRAVRARTIAGAAILFVLIGAGGMQLGTPSLSLDRLALSEPSSSQPSPYARSKNPIESAAATFPGSAFFFAEGAFDPAPDASAANSPHVMALRQVETALSSPFHGKTALDRYRALGCLTSAIYYEAANEPEEGQRAVAQVVLNRVRHPAWPDSVCEVVYQGSERTDMLCQFTFSCDGAMARAPVTGKWARARAVAEQALAGKSYAPAGLATFYHTLAVRPPWSSRLDAVAVIGAHIFYQMRGRGGTSAAFSAAYSGQELVSGPARRSWSPLPAGSQPVAMPYLPDLLSAGGKDSFSSPSGNAPIPSVQRDASAAAHHGAWTAPAASVPDLPGQKLPQSSIRPEYQDSGRPLI